MIYEFDECVLDSDRVVLTRSGEDVPLEPQVYDLLVYLIENRGVVLTKEQLLDNVWGDRFVSESALTTRVKSARRAVGDSGSLQAVIRTVHGKGYEFVADVQESGATGVGGVADVSRLPQPLTTLVGREETVRRLSEELESSRLVTLIGPGGVGKTSLGLEVCRATETRFADGVWPVELVTVVDHAATVEAVATALDVHAMQGRTIAEAVVDVLRPRQALVLLDNCEHVTVQVSAIVEELLQSAPGVSILATSREPLGIATEQVWPVDPLAVSLTDTDEQPSLEALRQVPAIRLFVERAISADPQFTLTDENADAVAEICRRLDGVPLAIELAAARVRALDVEEIATRLDERFRLLKGVRRGADPRHQTLEDAVRWSFDLLDADEQLLFRRLSVFAGQFDLVAAEAVCDFDGALEVMDCLTRLADRSMVAVRRDSASTSYELLETLREFAASRLDDAEKVGLFESHSRYYAGVAGTVEAGLGTSEEASWSRLADQSFVDLRAAVSFAAQVDDAELALRLVSAVREYGLRSMRYETLAWADTALGLTGAADSDRYAVVQALKAYGSWVRGDFERALEEVGQALESADPADHGALGLAFRTRANVQFILGHMDAGLEANETLLRIADESGRASQRAHANYMLSCAYSSLGRREDALEAAGAAHEAAAGSQSGTDAAGAYFADGLAVSGDDEAALAAFAECDQIARSVGNRWMGAFARTELNSILLRSGRTAEACSGMAQVLDTWFRSGDWSQQWLALSKSIPALVAIEDLEAAAELVGAVETHASIAPPPSNAAVREANAALLGEIEGRVGTDRFEQLRREGAVLPVEQVVHRTRLRLTA